MTERKPLLEVAGLSVRFGGLVAVNDISFSVGEGELLGIIGPNGAGKTTAFNAIAGAVRPSAGRISVDGNVISRSSPEKVARRGVARTFQSVRLFPRMTVKENIALAAMAVSASMKAAQNRADQVGEILSLEPLLASEAGALSLADQKRVEIGRALALSPKVLLLDEMMSGLNDQETEQLISVVRGLNDDGLTMIVIEHVIKVILDLSHRVLVLDNGSLIAQGPPREVMKDDRVVEAYLGRAAARSLGEAE